VGVLVSELDDLLRRKYIGRSLVARACWCCRRMCAVIITRP
jgi:hypothetical protein